MALVVLENCQVELLSMNENQQATPGRLIPFKDVSRLTGIKSVNTIKAKEDRGEFPLRRYLSVKCVRWSEAEIISYIDQLPRSFKEYQQRHDGGQEAA